MTDQQGMNVFPTDGGTIIHDGQFTSAHTINNYSIMGSPNHREDPWEILERNIAFDALFDSDARFDPPKCHPDTRTAVLDHIQRWAADEDSLPLMWVRGAAGAGKSAIAQTLSERWDEEGLLAASFYFSRTAAGRNEKYLIPTLAYQLATAIPNTRSRIEDAIRRTPKIFERNLRTQMRQLIINPLAGEPVVMAGVVVIDGLDECCIDYPYQDHEQQQKEILESIHLALGHKGFPLRFVIASRPERQIREIFGQGFLASKSSRTVLDHTQNPSADIELYVRYKFAEIRNRHPDLGSSWPPESVISELVSKASGHFIYASIVMRHLSSPRVYPDTALKSLMGVSPSPASGSPFAELDAVYAHVLKSVASQSLPLVMDVLGFMIYGNIGSNWLLFLDTRRMSPLFIAKYLFTSLGELHMHLTDLHSIMDIPPVGSPIDTPVSFFHASLGEFITQQSRSGSFYIDRKQASLRVLSLCIRHLFVQVLSPRGGAGYNYRPSGFAYEVGDALEHLNPSPNIVEALEALLTSNEDNLLRYIRQEGLDVYGTSRQSTATIYYLYRNIGGSGLPVVLEVLKRHGVNNLVPLIKPQTHDVPVVDDEGKAIEWNE